MLLFVAAADNSVAF